MNQVKDPSRQRVEAEIVTDDPDPVIDKLTELGFELEVMDWPCDLGTTIVATTFTEMGELTFFQHVDAIVTPLDGTLMEAGIVEQPSPVHKPGVVKRRFAWRF